MYEGSISKKNPTPEKRHKENEKEEEEEVLFRYIGIFYSCIVFDRAVIA
jgi:hypothetical protein